MGRHRVRHSLISQGVRPPRSDFVSVSLWEDGEFV